MEEISGMKMGKLVDEYMRKDPYGLFTGNRKDDRKLWKRCYRHVMQVLRVCSWNDKTIPGKKPRYSKENVEHILPDVYTDFCEWEREKEKD
jgi:hypothetical protein